MPVEVIYMGSNDKQQPVDPARKIKEAVEQYERQRKERGADFAKKFLEPRPEKKSKKGAD